MTAGAALFIALVVAWLALRFATRRWIGRHIANGTITMDRALQLHAATWALIPLIALPWASSMQGVGLLVALSIGMFVVQALAMRYAARFIRGG